MPSILNATTNSGLVTSADNSGSLQLQTNNGTTAVTINTSQGVQCLNSISVGNATPTTSGAGITFPATQSASTDANTLDDYEEGTFTPTITASSGSLGYANRAGRYTKIGNTVVCNFWIQWNANNSLSGASVFMSLPFISGGGGSRPSSVFRTVNFSVTGVVGGWIPNSDNRIQLNVFNNGGTSDVNASTLGGSGEFGGTVVYQVD